MTKKKTALKKQKSAQVKAFSWNELDKNSLTGSPALDYMGLGFDNTYNCYLPPINRQVLAKLPHQNAQHCGILNSRANMISSDYAGGALSKMDMRALCLNLIQFGDVGLLKIRNGFGQVVRLHVLSSLYLRVRKDGGYTYLLRKSLLNEDNEVYQFDAKDIIFIKLYDPMQQVYGSPDYVGGIQSALLNSDATIFRRRYFSNGAHMGFILYATDPDLNEEMEEELAKKIEQSRGVGNFKSMFINIPNGSPDGVKIIPIGDTGTKDEFANIKNISAQDILTAHRFPPGLGGIIPSNAGGLGDPIKLRDTYRQDEVLPMQSIISQAINSDPEIGNVLKVKFLDTKKVE
ncbi:phage portal protein [Avibacterium paragallinarum]|uniref:Probable capsid portal protein n=1 Tax=Avibacterium paragallinarum TaxID=728 RepID=A0A377I4F2_AVIPA|nr:phage portal protein [Avibacterium paragallinarum]POY46784.1 phage portal protein [Avibacterium paragallinarum]RZN74786.1 phage portal protein [Avibacterium paragallinarum]CDF98024.1 Putative Phage portal protein PBSX family [Avibacterium paragallinarum JF4211]STO70166.1 probable capsid portal protein [Avibacterium paragallinarum]